MKVNTFTKLAIGVGVVALSVAGIVVPAQADPSEPTNTALVGVGSDTTMDVMDEIASSIGGNLLASYKSTIGTGQTEFLQTRPDGPTDVLRAKGSGDGFKILTVAEGSATSSSSVSTFTGSGRTANKANSVGQVDFARASSKQGTASPTGEYVNVPFAIDSVGIAVNASDAVSKIPLEGLGTTSDAATKATVDSIFRCQARFVYINNIAVGAGTVTGATFTKATHGLVVGDRVAFSVASGSLPSGLTAGTNYFVISAPSANTFTVSATKTGTAITTGGSAAAITITKTMGAANTYNSVGALSADAPANTTAYQISPLIPAYGSGTASYFIGKIGRTEAAGFPSSGDAGQSCISRTFLDGTTPIQEHSGASVAERENSIGIYSIGQWTSQTNSALTGATNRTSGTSLLPFFPKAGGDTTVATGVFTSTAHGLIVGDAIRFSTTGTLPTGLTAGTIYFVKTVPSANTFTIAATAAGAQITPTTAGTGTLSTFKQLLPTTGAGATLAPNENWDSNLKRVVYNVMPYRKAADPNNPLNAMFVGTGSLVCQQTAAIAKMGFTVLSSTDPNNVNSCGSIASGNRAYSVAGDGSVVTGASIAALSTSTADVGEVVTTTVKIGTSNHQMGGTVQVLDAAYGSANAKVLGSATVAADVSGTTDTNIGITLTKPGATTLYAYFIPALGGIKVTQLNWGGTDATTTLTASAGEATVGLSVRKPSGIGGTGRVIATVTAPVAPGGTVELFKAGDDARSFTGVTSGAINTFTLANTVAGAAFTKTAAAAHGLVAGNPVKFSGTCPAGITVGTTYFVSATALTTTAFKVSASSGGTVVATTAASGTSCVVTAATPTVFTASAAHGLAVGNRVKFSTGTLPTGFVTGTNYFVASVPSTNTFTLAATSGGAGIAATANGSGTYEVLNTTPLASGTLSEGETAEMMSYTQTAATMSIFARFVSVDGSLLPSDSATATVTVPKLTATLAATLPAAPNGFVAGTSPVFANAAQTVQVGAVTATVTPAADTIGIASHGLTAGTVVKFSGTTLPGGLLADTNYWVISSGLTASVFKVSASEGGSAIDITSAGTAVKAFKSNVEPKATLTATAPAGATAKPSGTVAVFIGSSAVDRSHPIQVTGQTLAAAASGVAGTATPVLTKSATWTWLGTVPAAGKTVYLILDYSGDGVYGKATLTKQVKVTP